MEGNKNMQNSLLQKCLTECYRIALRQKDGGTDEETEVRMYVRTYDPNTI